MTLDLVGSLHAVSLQPGDTLVLMADRPISNEIRERLSAHLKTRFPNQTCLVLDSGLQIGVLSRDDRLARVERKIDTLIAALAEEEGADAPTRDLDGRPVGGDRDATAPLG